MPLSLVFSSGEFVCLYKCVGTLGWGWLAGGSRSSVRGMTNQVMLISITFNCQNAEEMIQKLNWRPHPSRRSQCQRIQNDGIKYNSIHLYITMYHIPCLYTHKVAHKITVYYKQYHNFFVLYIYIYRKTENLKIINPMQLILILKYS